MTAAELPSPLRPLPGGHLAAPSVGAAQARLRESGVEPMTWGNGPGDRYAAHEHGYAKLLVCAEGSITFLVGSDEAAVELSAGEGFELPPGTRHAAIVGPAGCTCVEGHRG
ncbi:MAG: cupin domain-containing protein [Chloroflexi bacterium]|nr:cupin domain-containing protein [Chloroflexota bacterium]